jgi:hypothetical protein
MNMTHHAGARSQQRGIPPFIMDCLDNFGEEMYDGHGAIIRYFNHVSRKKMERELGRDLVSKLAQYLNSYKVESLDGTVITAGHLTKRINRK